MPRGHGRSIDAEIEVLRNRGKEEMVLSSDNPCIKEYRKVLTRNEWSLNGYKWYAHLWKFIE